jgi:HEAT repeat protein
VAGDPSRRISWLWLAILVVALVLVAGFAGIQWSIHIGVRNASDLAVRAYPAGDRVMALVAFVESEDQPMAARNRAVWALGQLRDPRALPVLERHYTGSECDHARGLCQHELKKAIDLLRR